MKYSIKIRLVLVLMAVLSFTIVLWFLINILFLDKFYERYKLGRLGDTFVQVNAEYNDDDMDNLILRFDQIASKQNVSMYIFNGYWSFWGQEKQLLLDLKYPANLSAAQNSLLQQEVTFYYSGRLENSSSGSILMEERENYRIFRHFDERLETNYIELYGKLDNGHSIFIRTNYDNITESVGIANNFFAYIGMIAMVLGSVIMYIIGVSFTKPILKLADITKEISNLNFDVSYDEKREDEVGELGRSINSLSDKLETAISGLKSANNELQNDIKKKEKEEEIRKEFLSNVTHELKTPIALIQGYAEGLKDNVNADDEEGREFYCDVIIDESNKMNKMVKMLLNLNQIENGMYKPEFDRFDIVALLRSVLQSMDMLIRQKGANWEFFCKEPIYVWADEYLIEEVVTNYISNALNHVDKDSKGMKLISVKPVIYEERVRVSVFNTGEPIPEEDVQRIWDKFYKVDKARTREYGGSGIGLSIVKAIMESLNREFGLKNWDNGVEFWFELDRKA